MKGCFSGVGAVASPEEILRYFQQLDREAEAAGYGAGMFTELTMLEHHFGPNIKSALDALVQEGRLVHDDEEWACEGIHYYAMPEFQP